ncbi:DUF3413 domain-containing protein [Shewanella sp. NIFS-20-20]|uniref:DUF3413 domain-containing protein n=1 Tax=Shewanella sp. NIFS-20-20 TaxID=2853806 RepID=UPI001C47D5D0|nr:DUF3413 domain-containing protein [Shewanella sp. NIFS-20-20]MBV7316611.1 DUF3413 domain-containing protein [Shewanella sp. NIFS-20-20]
MVERQKQLVRDKVSRLVNWGHWFAFFNGILAMIIGSRYIETVGSPESLLGWGYLAISTIGHFSFLAFIVYLVLLFPISLLLPYSKILRGYAAIVATLSLCALLYDTIIFDDYGLHLSPFVFDLAWADLHALLKGTSYIVTPLAILAIELTAANYLWKRVDKIQKRHVGPKIVAIVGLCFVSSHLIHIWADATDVTQITRYDQAYPLSYPATARTFMARHGIDSDNQDRNLNFDTKLQYPAQALQCDVTSTPNILMITIDSLRADLVDAATMPFLSQYAANNLDFTQHYAGGDQFSSSMFSLLYGLQGSYLDAVELQNMSPLLTQSFRHAGYHLGLFISPNNMQGLTPAAMFNDFTVHLSGDDISEAAADKQAIAQFTQWRPSQTPPWFALLDLTAPQSYDTPIGFLGVETVKPPKPLKAAERVLFNQYRQSLNFIDSQLAEIIPQLPADTMVIITGITGKVFSFNQANNHDLSPENVRVPMIIHWPGKGPQKINDMTSHHGLVNTLLQDVLGCEQATSQYTAGRKLLSPNEDPWIYIGDNRIFAIYQPAEITVIDRHGQYSIYDKDYQQQLNKKLSAPELIQVMREGRRLYKH